MRNGVRIILLTLITLNIVIEHSFAASGSDFESLFKPIDAAAIAGDGRLTISINRSGRITACHWPSPGYFEQIAYETRSRSEPLLGVESWHGAAWALRIGEQLIWMYDDRWSHAFIKQHTPSLIEIESSFEGRNLRVRQRIRIAKTGNEFEYQITVSGNMEAPPTAYWYANFSPSTRLIPHLPVSTKSARDFAAFLHPDGNAVIHFRPSDPSSQFWRQARRLVGSDIEWPVFPKGSYVVYASPNETSNVAVGQEQGHGAVVDQVNAGTLSNQRSAVGQTASAIEMQMHLRDSDYTAAVVVAFGTSYTEAAQRLSEYRNDGGASFQSVISTDESDVAWIKRRAMSTMRTCTDAQTGSVVRTPANVAQLATDQPRYGVWIAHAWNAAGYRNRAIRLLEFYSHHVRERPRGDVPIGSIPAAVYTNGVEAAPEALVDAAAAGRALWAIDQLGASLPPEEMQAFYRSVWPGVSAIADFLVRWRQPGGVAPLYTFDYASMRDRRTTELYVASYLGVRAANRIANAIKEPRPDWHQAANELRDALRLHALHPDGAVAIMQPGMLHGTGIVPESDRFDWPHFIQSLLRESGGRLDIRSLEQLCKLVLSARNIPEEMRAEVASAVRRHLDRETPDAANAAFAYLIAHKLQEIEHSPPIPIEQVTPDTP